MIHLYIFYIAFISTGESVAKKIQSHGYCVFLFKFAGQTFGYFIERFDFFKDVKSHIKDFTLT